MPTPAPDPRPAVLIIGAGFSGTLTAVHLLRRGASAGWRIMLLERRSRIGRGLAYHTWDDNLLLNVPAGNMSALPDEPGHFVDYLHTVDPAFNTGSFVSRRIYGDYLEFTLAEAERLAPAALTKLHGEVVSIRRNAPQSTGFTATLADGRRLEAERVVLAFGHFGPQDPQAAVGGRDAQTYIGNSWDFDAIDRTDASRPVAVIGAGHTGIDVVFRLTRNSDSRKVFLISRRGLLPHGHRFTPKAPAPGGFPEYLRTTPATLAAHVRAIREQAERKMAAGGDWRDVLNELRAHTPAIWQRLELRDRRKFLNRLVPYWDIHRHRLAPAAFLRLEQMLRSGQVETIAGHVQTMERRADGRLDLVVRGRRGGELRRLDVGAVVNCTGPNYDIATLTAPLPAQLRDDGMIRQDALRLGIEFDEGYRVTGRDGSPVSGLYYIGPMLKARYWEAIAVPELRVHAFKLASVLLGQADRLQ
jgi:uncharacterized NAD(P)/FAD-binding protein YdhS